MASVLFRSDVQHDVVREIVTSRPGTRSAADLARTLRRPESSVTRVVRELVDGGLVRATGVGRRRLLQANYADPWMRAVREAFAGEAAAWAERERDVAWWRTVPEVAERTAALLAEGAEDQALRELLDAVNQLPLLAAVDRLDQVLDAPSSTGDERWDALLAGAVRFQLRLLGRPAPGWTRRDPLPSWWWPGGGGARAALAMRGTPPELARLGIWLDARNFTTA